MFPTTKIAILAGLLFLGTNMALGQEALDQPTMLAQLRSFHVDPASIEVTMPDSGSTTAPDRDREKEFRDEMAVEMNKIQSCAETRHFADEGHVQAVFSVLPTGEFVDVSVVDDFPNPEPKLVRCVWDTLEHLRLDSPPDHERPFHVTFVFNGPMKVEF